MSSVTRLTPRCRGMTDHEYLAAVLEFVSDWVLPASGREVVKIIPRDYGLEIISRPRAQ